MNNFHTPVLLKEIIEHLRIEKGKKYIDATIGGGGHSLEILKRGGEVLGIDCDQDAIEYIKSNFQFSPDSIGINFQLKLVKGNFREIDKIAHSKGFEKVSGIIFDLGVSSHQLEVPERGFSFQKEAELDMRMDRELAVKAKDLLQALTKGELYELFSKLGEESNARRISELIISARKINPAPNQCWIKPIATTQDLVKIIEEAKSFRRFSNIHPATKVFQALRIAVNDELNVLKDALPKSVKLLNKKGRLLIISFHSLEERIVKQNFRNLEQKHIGKIITRKPITPTIEEQNLNRRSRSAKLRVFEKN